MDWLLFTGLMVAGVVFTVAMTFLWRCWAGPRPLPVWAPIAGMIIAGVLLAFSVLGSHWLLAATSALNLITFGMVLIVTRRARAS